MKNMNFWRAGLVRCTEAVLFRIRISGVQSGRIIKIFLDPAPDWISFLLKPDPDYPKRFEHFLIFLRFVFFPAKILLIT